MKGELGIIPYDIENFIEVNTPNGYVAVFVVNSSLDPLITPQVLIVRALEPNASVLFSLIDPEHKDIVFVPGDALSRQEGKIYWDYIDGNLEAQWLSSAQSE